MSADYIATPDGTHDRWKKFKKAGEAYKDARFYMWIGLISGFALLAGHHLLHYLAERIPEWVGPDGDAVRQLAAKVAGGLMHGLSFVFEHVGLGLIVSAIAIFFYEWGAHIKETIDLSAKLASGVEHTKRMMEAVNMNKRLNELNTKRAEERLGYSLDTLIGGAGVRSSEKPKYLRDVISNCQKLVLAIADLHSRNDWASEQYVTFISKHIEKVVGHNAQAFSKLYEKKGEQHFIVPPTAAQMADEILAAQMQSLKAGGRYDVISDLPSWQGNQLYELHKATRIAVEQNNVHVRRVFNLIRGVPPGTKQTLIKHLEHSDTWKCRTGDAVYEVKVLGVDAYKKLSSRGYDLQRIEDAHFGVFINGHDKVRFKVTERNLSDMELSKDPQLVDPSLEMFELVWKFATDFPAGEKIGERARDRIDQLLREIDDWEYARSNR